MRRVVPMGVAALTLTLAACQDVAETVAPPDPSAVTLEPTASFQVQQAETFVPGRVLVGLADGVDPAAFAAANGVALERAGAAFSILRGAAGNERALAARLGGQADVLWAEPDWLRQPTEIDPRLWAFQNPGDLFVRFTRGRNGGDPVGSYLSLQDADEDNVEGYAAGGAPVSIASIDTGVDFGHPEFLPGQLVAGWDFYDNDPDPSDSDGHGTHTTGTMVGRTVGIAGVSGAGANVTVHVYRVCGPLGCPTSAIADAIRAAADAGVAAMNLSLGGGSLGSAEQAAIDYALARNALVIASAGNAGVGTVSCPACDPDAISVAASNWQDERSYYSSWGPGLDMTAPGGELYSNTTDEAGIYSSVPGGYAYFQGTSMAAPQVTGTAGIVASVTGLRGGALRARLEGSVDDLGPSGYDTDFGWGRLNSYRAVTNTTLNEGDPPPPPPPPADLAAAFSFGCSQLDCSFDASASTGSIASYDWTFGDGGTGSGVTTSHTYAGPGDYTVTLTVGDGAATDQASQVISCEQKGPRVRCR